MVPQIFHLLLNFSAGLQQIKTIQEIRLPLPVCVHADCHVMRTRRNEILPRTTRKRLEIYIFV